MVLFRLRGESGRRKRGDNYTLYPGESGEVFNVVSQFFSREGKRKGEWRIEVEF